MALRPEDYEAIRNLYGRYSLASDTGDADAFAECFLPDGVNTFDGLPAHLGRNGSQSGRNEIRALAAGIFAGGQGHLLHSEVPMTIEGDGDVARAIVYVQVFRRGQSPHPGVILTATGEDTLKKTDVGWRFALRVGHMNVSPQDADALSADALVHARDQFIQAGAKLANRDVSGRALE